MLFIQCYITLVTHRRWICQTKQTGIRHVYTGSGVQTDEGLKNAEYLTLTYDVILLTANYIWSILISGTEIQTAWEMYPHRKHEECTSCFVVKMKQIFDSEPLKKKNLVRRLCSAPLTIDWLDTDTVTSHGRELNCNYWKNPHSAGTLTIVISVNGPVCLPHTRVLTLCDSREVTKGCQHSDNKATGTMRMDSEVERN